MDGVMEDPFAGILGRSSVAQALREARASLARPTRPFTPANRSLFAQARSPECSRPSSSYSIGQLRFEKDMFASSSESTISTRSTLHSRNSEHGGSCGSTCVAIPEELEEPELQLSDVGVFADSGEFVAECRPATPCIGVPLIRCTQVGETDGLQVCELQLPPEEYEAEAADDLALRIDVPPTASDDDSEEDEAMPSQAEGKPRAPSKVREALNRPARKKSSKKADRSFSKASESSKDWLVSLETMLADVEACHQLEDVVDQLRQLANELQCRTASQQLQAVPKVLRTTLRLMDRQQVNPSCLIRLARNALELMSLLVAAGEDRSSDSVQAAYLNIAKALFKLSKDAAHDNLFKSVGLLDALLAVLAEKDARGESSDLRIFVIGILKNVTNNEENVKYIAKQGIFQILQGLMQLTNSEEASKQAQLFVQITALLRNLVASAKRSQHVVELGILHDITRISARYSADQELQTNVARVLAKLSLHDDPCQAFETETTHMHQVVQILTTHADSPSLALRLVFVLGNLTSRSDRLREMFWFSCGGATLLPNLMKRYWQKDRKLAQAEHLSQSADAHECEGVLVKLVRLAANVAISPSVGIQVAACSDCVDPLLDILGCKRMSENEELVLNATAATTNLLFYGESTNLLFSADNKELLCRLLRPLLLESYNVEALVEAARALGNLSRHQDARQWIAELRIDEILAIFMAHDDRDLVFYTCGALVNIVADATHGGRLCSQIGLRLKLAAVLGDAPSDDIELQLVAVKVLSNLWLSGNSEAPWAAGELAAVHTGLDRVARQLENGASGEDDEASAMSSSLAELVAKLRDSIPRCLDTQACNAEAKLDVVHQISVAA
mmetsp:Transcript_13446/g.22140  ORF Transcript_13446/g.22140 Transcript_13446/m.22140 type:complete len:849 (-) Transcript_13446:172-2718(-)